MGTGPCAVSHTLGLWVKGSSGADLGYHAEGVTSAHATEALAKGAPG